MRCAPALANASMKSPGRSIIRCTSSGKRVALLNDATMGTPMEILGTKWPSITSTWITAAPADSTARTCSPKTAKFAAKMDGAISSGRRVMKSIEIVTQPQLRLLRYLQFDARAGLDARAALRKLRRHCSRRPACQWQRSDFGHFQSSGGQSLFRFGQRQALETRHNIGGRLRSEGNQHNHVRAACIG